MKVNIEDVLFWMDAIRNSDDRYRTLESFWKGQVHSKEWLVQTLNDFDDSTDKHVVVHGGWNGVLSSLLFNSNLNIQRITSIDIDPTCEEIAYTINKRYEMQGRFKAITEDMCTYTYHELVDIVINTSCEHITQSQYNKWLTNQPKDALIVLQSNNYFDLDEHIRCASNLDEFEKQSDIDVLWSGEYNHPKYKRFMLIGYKHHV